MKIREPKPPGTLWATPGLLGTPLQNKNNNNNNNNNNKHEFISWLVTVNFCLKHVVFENLKSPSVVFDKFFLYVSLCSYRFFCTSFIKLMIPHPMSWGRSEKSHFLRQFFFLRSSFNAAYPVPHNCRGVPDVTWNFTRRFKALTRLS